LRDRIASMVEVAAACLLGVMAGFFFAFAVDVAPAMTNLEASGYIATQQWINRAVRNAAFGVSYFGSTLMPFAAAGAACWSGRRRDALAWLLIAIVYFTAVFWTTRTISVPINEALASWRPSAPPHDWQAARDTWNQANLVRTIASVGCFVSSVVLLSISRSSPPRP
jgi:uncharacterized membrane protein